MIHDSRIDWPPPYGAPVTFCCHLDAEPYDPVENDWEGYYGADVTVGVTWWDTWAEAIEYWRESIAHTGFHGTEADVAKMLLDQITELDALAAKYA